MRIIDKLKVWLTLPFAMPGPIALGSLDKLLALIASLGLVFTMRQSIPIPTFPNIAYAITNALSNSRIPFLRCEILHKLNVTFSDPARWQSHPHLSEFSTQNHFAMIDRACADEAGLTPGQVTFLNKLPTSLKEIYRQRMFAAISTGDSLKFGYRKEDIPDRHMTEDKGVVTLHDGTHIQ